MRSSGRATLIVLALFGLAGGGCGRGGGSTTSSSGGAAGGSSGGSCAQACGAASDCPVLHSGCPDNYQGCTNGCCDTQAPPSKNLAFGQSCTFDCDCALGSCDPSSGSCQ